MEQGKSKRFPRQTEEVKSKPKERERSGRNWRITTVKVVLVPLLLFFSVVVGLMIGYGGVGNKPIAEVFDLGTYKHMWDLMFADT